MSKRWYAVQHGDNFECDNGSTVKRKAMQRARQMHRDYPGEEIRICLCREDDDFCEGEIIVFNGWRVEEK